MTLPDDVVELKPCPFCGGKAHWPEPEVNMPWVGCTECGASIEDEVRWNTRAALEAARYGEMRQRLADSRSYLEAFRLKEAGKALMGEIDRMPVRQLCKHVDALLSTIGEPNPDLGATNE